MFAANIRWTPVRLESRRIDNNRHEILRGGELRGIVEFHKGVWRSRKPPTKYSRGDIRDHESWRGAVLHLVRYSMLWTSSDGPQDYGQVRMLRINCATAWYTVIADGDRRYVYQDFTIPDEPEGRGQAMLRKVLAAAEGHLRDAPLRVVG
jgi:hypothetical protein